MAITKGKERTPEHLAEVSAVSSARFGVLRRLSRQPATLASLALLALVCITAIAAPLIAPASPSSNDLSAVLQPPSGEHLLGTDRLGRDVLSRLIFASRASLLAPLQAVAVAMLIGVPVGLLSGYLGGRLDAAVVWLTDAGLSLPPLLFAMAIVGMMGPSLRNAMVAVGIVYVPRMLRVARGIAITIREQTFIEAADSIGASKLWILRRHVLINAASPIIVQASLMTGLAMLAEASLSFLGLGVQPPQASWGGMMGDAFRTYRRAPWLIFFPGTAVALTVLALNVLGDGIRDAIGKNRS